jgi:hypothetical protein
MLDAALLARFEEHMARPSIPVNFVAGSASRFLIRGPLILAGYSFRETAGLAASFSLRDGLDVGGTLVANGDVAANGMAQLQMGRDGPYCFRGIFVQMLSGTLDGSVWVKI